MPVLGGGSDTHTLGGLPDEVHAGMCKLQTNTQAGTTVTAGTGDVWVGLMYLKYGLASHVACEAHADSLTYAEDQAGASVRRRAQLVRTLPVVPPPPRAAGREAAGAVRHASRAWFAPWVHWEWSVVSG